MTFYKYILLYKKIWFGEIKNLSTPFYSLSFIYAYLNIKSALNCGRPEYNWRLSPINKWQLFQGKWLAITMDVPGSDHWILSSESNTYLELTAQHPKGNRYYFFFFNIEWNIPH